MLPVRHAAYQPDPRALGQAVPRAQPRVTDTRKSAVTKRQADRTKEEEGRAYLDVGLGLGGLGSCAWDLVPGVCVRMTLMCRPATSRLEQQLSQSRTGRATGGGGMDGRTVRQQEQGRRGQEQHTQVTQST